jgi:antitoxin Phd
MRPDACLLLYSGAVRRRRRLGAMSEPARELPADSPAVANAVENARQGVITHLTVGGKRVAAIVPESVVEALRAAEDAEDAAEADAAMDEPGESIPWEQVKAELDL